MLRLPLSEIYNSTYLYNGGVCKAEFNWDSPNIFSNFNPLNTDTPLLPTVFLLCPLGKPENFL